jgi:hypothetical protein
MIGIHGNPDDRLGEAAPNSTERQKEQEYARTNEAKESDGSKT